MHYFSVARWHHLEQWLAYVLALGLTFKNYGPSQPTRPVVHKLSVRVLAEEWKPDRSTVVAVWRHGGQGCSAEGVTKGRAIVAKGLYLFIYSFILRGILPQQLCDQIFG